MKEFYHGIRFALPVSLIMWALFVLLLLTIFKGDM